MSHNTMSSNGLHVPKSAYPRAFGDFDSSLQDLDDVEGDISLRADLPPEDDDESSFDELLEPNGRRGSVFKEESASSSRKGSILKQPVSPKPRGYEFKLKTTQCLIYLTYPSTGVEIDNYGKIEYELKTKEKSMVVIIPNSKGLSINNKKLADAYAIRTGCVTALVDVYFDDALNLENPVDDPNDSLIAKFKTMAVGLALNVRLSYWLQCHNVFGAYNEGRYQSTSNWVEVEKCIEELLTSSNVQNAVIIGFSFGANTALRFAIESDDKRIKSTVIVHPIMMPHEVFEHVKIPTLLLVGKEDNFYSRSDLAKFEEDLATKKNSALFKCVQLKHNSNTPHGFAIAGDYSPVKVGDLPFRACEIIVSWVLGKI